MSAEPTTREVTGDPGTLPTLLKAVLPAVPGLSLLPGLRRSGATLPPLVLSRRDVVVDPGHVAAYSGVCGYDREETLPLTYPHVLAFGLHMRILTDRAFPFPAAGAVHLENSITRRRRISAEESLRVTARPEHLRTHRRGAVFDIVTEVHSAGELVWQETSTFLHRGHVDGPAADGGAALEQVAPTGIEWRLPGDLGRRYAAVSGDHNPIHLYAITARAFGFPRPIAHGMWSTARCVAELGERLPPLVRVDVAFKKPVLLPGTVAFGCRQAPADRGHASSGWDFALSDPRSGAPHLLGRASALRDPVPAPSDAGA